jgi:hypothetical protein
MLNNRYWRVIPKFALFLSLFAFSIGKAEAIPAFAKKYSVPCTFCHSSWPLLNSVGWKFKLNGFQLPETRDGAEVGKTSPSFDLHLDANKGVSPLSFRLYGGLDVLSPNSAPGTIANPSGSQAWNFPCCTEGVGAGLYAGGTVEEDMAYYVSYKLGAQQIGDGNIKFVNFFGPSYMAFDIGSIQTADFAVVTPNREWFGTPNPAFFGVPGVIGGTSLGSSVGGMDTGARIYGNPNSGPFTYDFVWATGNQTTSQSNSRGSAFGLTARVDIGGFATSLGFWNSKTNRYYLTQYASNQPFYLGTALVTGTGGLTVFSPDPTANSNETTQNYVWTMSYLSEKWQTDFAVVGNDFVYGNGSSGANTFQMENVRRIGASAAWIYRFGSRAAFGMRAGLSSTPGYKETFNAAAIPVPSVDAGQAEMKLELSPVQNAKLSLEYIADFSGQSARTNYFGNQYGPQNKLFLIWDWAI